MRQLESFRIIAFTHRTLPLELIGKITLNHDQQLSHLGAIKVALGYSEIMYLSTCNRVEFLVREGKEVDDEMQTLLSMINSRLTEQEKQQIVSGCEVFQGDAAVEHVLKVVSSLDSMVIGEREIITQFRKAYEFCNQAGLTGDFMRLLVKCAIETGKEIYTHTGIAKNPVSVASLAYRQLRSLGVKSDSRIVFVGSGETNTLLAQYFKKHKLANFTVFNRTLGSAKQLADTLNGRAFELSALSGFDEGFDVLVVCTASPEPVVTKTVFEQLRKGESDRKIVIDLGVPANVDSSVSASEHVHYIDIESLRVMAEKNLSMRAEELDKCIAIIGKRKEEFMSLHQERRVEIAFGEIPRKVKEIRETALNEVFARDVDTLDAGGREVLEKVLAYMEKKYNAVAIKTAKEVLLSQKSV